MKKTFWWWFAQATILTMYFAFIAGMGLVFGASLMAKFLDVAYLLIGGKL